MEGVYYPEVVVGGEAVQMGAGLDLSSGWVDWSGLDERAADNQVGGGRCIFGTGLASGYDK
jgi:hypothetical protein